MSSNKAERRKLM